MKEFEAQSFEAIIYIKNIDELTKDGHKQVAEVLNRYDQPVNWLLYLQENKGQLNQKPSLQLGHYYHVSELQSY